MIIEWLISSESTRINSSSGTGTLLVSPRSLKVVKLVIIGSDTRNRTTNDDVARSDAQQIAPLVEPLSCRTILAQPYSISRATLHDLSVISCD